MIFEQVCVLSAHTPLLKAVTPFPVHSPLYQILFILSAFCAPERRLSCLPKLPVGTVYCIQQIKTNIS
jgi:hypothetical protein